MHTNIVLAPNPIFPCCRVLYFFKYAFSSIMPGILELYHKSTKNFAFDILSLKSKTTSQKLFGYDCITLYLNLSVKRQLF